MKGVPHFMCKDADVCCGLVKVCEDIWESILVKDVAKSAGVFAFAVVEVEESAVEHESIE